MKRSLFLLPLLFSLGAMAVARPQVVTFSQGDVARVASQLCGVTPTQGKIGAARRNTAGNLVYFVVNHREAVLYGRTDQPGTCNKLDDDIYDIWRDDNGQPVAQRLRRSEGDLIVVGQEAEMRGRRFDVERSGQYMMTSHGTTSTVTAVSRPYRVLHKSDMDAQRIFARKRGLVLVGDNPATGRMEARHLVVTETGIMEQPPIQMGGLPAGVRVLDYNEATDDVLLGGVTPDGSTSFVLFNLSSGSATSVQPQKPGDDLGLFVDSGQIRAALTGSAAPAQGGGGQPARRGLLPFGR